VIKPYKDQSGSRKEQIEVMFDRIAGRYDFLNHLLSFSVDKSWRKKLVFLVKKNLKKDGKNIGDISILDVATGTGDLAFALSGARPSIITGLDISAEMLAIARQKAEKKNLKIDFIQGDSENLPFDDSEFDIVTVAFGIRNFENLDQGLKEMCRVLKPGGRVFILEFSLPRPGIYRFLYKIYSQKILPIMASIFAVDPEAYHYLPSSIAIFPSGNEMATILEDSGFSEVEFKRLSGGIASIYYGKSSSLIINH
jgi:demethylmenaquinone methyltransferase/2-methoxy-6-polyprenyl-1,4-benzoquinol methylase